MRFTYEVEPPDATVLDAVAQVGIQVGRALERKELERQIAIRAIQEQQRIGRELHDTLGQQITGLGMLAQSLLKRLEARGLKEESEGLGRLVQAIDEAKGDVRRLSKGLSPVEVDADGLMSALNELAIRCTEIHGLPCEFICHEPVPIHDSVTATHLYYIAQEAVLNAAKHARASLTTIQLRADAGRVVLRIEDDGTGFQPEKGLAGGLGLRIMQHRASLIGATLRTESTPGRGVVTTCTID